MRLWRPNLSHSLFPVTPCSFKTLKKWPLFDIQWNNLNFKCTNHNNFMKISRIPSLQCVVLLSETKLKLIFSFFFFTLECFFVNCPILEVCYSLYEMLVHITLYFMVLLSKWYSTAAGCHFFGIWPLFSLSFFFSPILMPHVSYVGLFFCVDLCQGKVWCRLLPMADDISINT